MEKFNELFTDVFSKTEELLEGSILNEENDQASHILEYLALFACYLKGPDEAACFKEHWLQIKERLKSIANLGDFMNQVRMMEAHIEQSLRSESVHHPNDSRNLGIYHFYENQFPRLYEQAKKAKEKYWEKQNKQFDYVDRLQNDPEFFDREAEKNPNVWLYLD